MTEHTLVAIRSDLVRVARCTHEREGYAPSLRRYRLLGRYSDVRVRAAVGGYRTNHGERSTRWNKMGTPPRLSWTQAVRRYGLKPYHEAYHPTSTELLRDVRRVALHCGHPLRAPSFREYRQHGEYAGSAVQRRFGGWNEAMKEAGLEPNNRGGDTPYHRESRRALHGLDTGRAA